MLLSASVAVIKKHGASGGLSLAFILKLVAAIGAVYAAYQKITVG